MSKLLQGDPSAHGLGYVDINTVSFGGYPETELSHHNPVPKLIGHPVLSLHSGAPRLRPHRARGLRRLQPLQQHLHCEALPRSRL